MVQNDDPVVAKFIDDSLMHAGLLPEDLAIMVPSGWEGFSGKDYLILAQLCRPGFSHYIVYGYNNMGLSTDFVPYGILYNMLFGIDAIASQSGGDMVSMPSYISLKHISKVEPLF